MSNKIENYTYLLSPPARTVSAVLKLLKIPHEDIILDLSRGEQHKPENLAKNPSHKVPMINEDGFCLTESRAICTYLLDKYRENNSQIAEQLYPKNDLKARAKINSALQKTFDLHDALAKGAVFQYALKVEPWATTISKSEEAVARIKSMEPMFPMFQTQLENCLKTANQPYVERDFSTEKMNLADLYVLDEAMTAIELNPKLLWENYAGLQKLLEESKQFSTYEEHQGAWLEEGKEYAKKFAALE